MRALFIDRRTQGGNIFSLLSKFWIIMKLKVITFWTKPSLEMNGGIIIFHQKQNKVHMSGSILISPLPKMLRFCLSERWCWFLYAYLLATTVSCILNLCQKGSTINSESYCAQSPMKEVLANWRYHIDDQNAAWEWLSDAEQEFSSKGIKRLVSHYNTFYNIFGNL